MARLRARSDLSVNGCQVRPKKVLVIAIWSLISLTMPTKGSIHVCHWLISHISRYLYWCIEMLRYCGIMELYNVSIRKRKKLRSHWVEWLKSTLPYILKNIVCIHMYCLTQSVFSPDIDPLFLITAPFRIGLYVQRRHPFPQSSHQSIRDVVLPKIGPSFID